MANRQTRFLRKKGVSLHFNKGVNFSHGQQGSEISFSERPLFTGKACDTSRGGPGQKQRRDRDGKLRTLSGKRTLDKRINGPLAPRVYV